MWRFILMTFVFLGWSFYELSGGADFEPEQRIAVRDSTPNDARSGTITGISTATARPGADTPIASRPAVTLPQTTTFVRVTLARLSVSEIGSSNLALGAEKARLLTQRQAPHPVIQNAAVLLPIPEKLKDIRSVRGTRVNMRGGPGTRYSVVAKLTKGMQVEILRIPGNGWIKLRVMDTGRVGWMAERLVTLAAN